MRFFESQAVRHRAEEDFSKEILKRKKNHLRRPIEFNCNCFEISDFDKKMSCLQRYWKSLDFKMSINEEKWSAQRRRTLAMLRELLNTLEELKDWATLGRVVFSSVDAIGIGVALFLRAYESKWFSSVLFASGSVGITGLALSLIEAYMSHTKIESILEELSRDNELFLELCASMRKVKELDRKVNDLFPFGVDLDLVDVCETDSPGGYIFKKELLDDLKHVDIGEGHPVLSKVIILSNVRFDATLSKSENFMDCVRKFSTSNFGKEWWNRITNPKPFPSSTLPQAITKLKYLLRDKTAPLYRIPAPLLTSSAMFSEEWVPASMGILLNSVMALDAFLQLNSRRESKEFSALDSIERTLKAEYGEVTRFYEILNPHYN